MNNSLSFVFKGYDADLEKGQVLFHYQIRGDKNIDFTEKIYFPPVTTQIPPALLKSILNNLMLILGISYWKTYCPKEIVIESNFLTKEMANFWNIVYIKGLGEFFYKNKIDFRGLVKFPYVVNVQEKAITFARKGRALLGLGGGKDSIVTAELLKSQNKDFDLFTVGTSIIQEGVAKIIGKKPILIKRELDPKLFELNKKTGVYNGHIPVSVIYAMLGIMAGAFYDYKSFVVGNEKSANYGNVEYLGEMINHQWSKSEKFEALLNDYVRKFITPDISYSSPLRNMSELEVVREFVKYPKYFKVFSSCNANFKILRSAQNDIQGKWCGKCPKCLFVFICLSAFLSKEKVLDIFGKNLFEDKSLLKTFKELLGLENFKPFECVGTPEEMKFALERINNRGEFNESLLMEFYVKN
ncbi:MAG: hypothetical protein A3D74_02005 [Candidatus Levybacteria bacterium RIFCSPHIGHO2_02_FULL_37_13]|nr:MAG: hypothetical protein A3D74_02005 [Candidatus Levybacteria bacterium RIFCSPHIGHO2_02_FULL_37_13]